MSEEDKNVTSLEDEVTVGEETKEKKPGKKKGCLTVIIILVALGIIGSFLDAEEGAPEPPEQQAAETTAGDTEEEKTYTEEQKTAFQNWYDQVLATHEIADNASAKYETVTNNLAEGKISIFEAYDQINTIKKTVETAWRTINDIETPKVLEKEHRKTLNEAISDLSTGLYTKAEGFEKVLEYLDEQKPSTLSEAKEEFEMAQGFMMGGIAKIVGVQMELGLGEEQQQKQE